MIKKIMSILVLAVLLIGMTPLAMAKNAQAVNIAEKEKELGERIVSSQTLKAVSREFNQAKQAYAKATKATQEQRQSFLESSKQLRACKDGETEQCTALREQVNSFAKNLVLKGIDAAIEHLNQLKAKVQGSEDVDEAKVQAIVSDIESSIVKLEGLKADVEAAQTKSEIKEAAKKVKTVWSRIRTRERVYAAKLVHAKVWNILKRAENLEVKLEKVLARIQAKGSEIDDLETKLAEFEAKIAEARAKYQEGEELINQAFADRTDEDKGNKVMADVKDARILIREAHVLIKEAHQILQSLVRSINQAGSSLEESEEDDEEEQQNLTQTPEGDLVVE